MQNYNVGGRKLLKNGPMNGVQYIGKRHTDHWAGAGLRQRQTLVFYPSSSLQSAAVAAMQIKRTRYFEAWLSGNGHFGVKTNESFLQLMLE